MADATGPSYSPDPDESGEVELDDDEKKGPVDYDEDDPNLVFDFAESDEGKEYLRDLSKRIRSRFDTAWEASEDYRERFKKDWKLLECTLDKRKGGEFELRPHLPIMLKNITRLAFRAESELFGDWSRPITYAPDGETPESVQKAEARTKHTNWQYREQIPDFARQMARGLMAFFTAGEVIGKSYRDTARGRNRHEVLTPDEFVMPYVYTSVMPDLSDAPWYAQVLRLYEHDLLEKKDEWFGIDEVLEKAKPTWDTDPEQPLRESIGEREGQSDESAKDDAPYKFLQYEGWETELPGQDEPRWIQAIFDVRTGALLKLAIHEEPTLQELDRFDRESTELQEYRAALDHHQQLQDQAHSALDLAEATGMPAPPEAEQSLRVPPPQPPMWMAEGEDPEKTKPRPPAKKPIFMFARAVNIENLAGNHGIGHGRMQAHYNRVGNTALREYTDAAVANNIPSYFIDDKLVIDGGKESIKFQPGSLHKVATSAGANVKDGIMPFQSPIANPQLIELARLMDELAQESAQSPDVLSGEPGKSGETFRGLASRVEQAVKQLSVPTGRFAQFVRQLTKNNAQLNAVFLEDEEVVAILDKRSGKYDMVKVGRALYESGSFDASVTSDLRFISKRERVAEADEVLAMGKALPPPLVMQPGMTFWWWSTMKKALEARGMYDLVPALGPPPDPPQTPFGLPPPAPPMPPGLPGAQPAANLPPEAGGMPPPPGSQPAQGAPPSAGG